MGSSRRHISPENKRKIKLSQTENRKGNEGLADRILFSCVMTFVAATAALMKWEDAWYLVMLQSLSAAAIVGGIADWYGVVSIYGRPLGISYHTEIIVQKRQALLTAIRSFVCDDILSKGNITVKLQGYPLTACLLDFFDQDRKKDGPFLWLSNFVSAIIFEIIQNVAPQEFSQRLNVMLKMVACRISLSQGIIRIARWTLDNGYDNRVIDILTPGLRRLVKNKGFQAVISEFTQTFHRKYAIDNWLRGLVNFRERVEGTAFDLIDNFLQEFEDRPHHPLRKNILHWLRNALTDLEQSKTKQSVIDNWARQLLDNTEVVNVIQGWIIKLKSTTFSKENCNNTAQALLGKIIDRLLKDTKAQSAFNEWIIGQLIAVVDNNHKHIGDIVDASLNDMSDRELVHFVREGTENDLQFIRMNGMGFGVLIGLAVTSIRIFLVS